jgi:hypothetical protein
MVSGDERHRQQRMHVRFALTLASGSDVDQREPLQFSELIEWICWAEGVAVAELTSLEVTDGDVIARFMRPSGRSRVSTYPLSAFSRWTKGNIARARG